jgi:hypothetical protein
MGEKTEHITVAETSDGPGGSRPAGESVSLPVVELLTGRGFVTGKSGSGKSNSASVIAERLLDNEFGLLIVDIDGEYYGLKEAYEILHVGADEECDIQVTTDHAEKLAGLALEQNVPIILDVSSYLDESEAEAMLTEVARSLFAKAKKQKQPFLLLVEEIHEYIPEQGSVGECGQMLIKIGKRGRKHGLGLCGISQRPADVKKDFITQCDWLLWHRLTWQNDTRVVRRILDGKYADAVESLDDGEGFLVTDWTDDVRRVQFHRKDTFDAGATPGLEDVERPALKSVSEDLVSELAEISNEASARKDRIAELESKLEKRESRIEELERELHDARNLQDLAEQFVEALTGYPATGGDHPTVSTGDPTDRPGGTVVTDHSRGADDREPATAWPGGWRESEASATADATDTTDGTTVSATDEDSTDTTDGTAADATDEDSTDTTDGTTVSATDEEVAATVEAIDGESSAVFGGVTDEEGVDSLDSESPTAREQETAGGVEGKSRAADERPRSAGGDGVPDDTGPTRDTGAESFSADRILSRLEAAPGPGGDHSRRRTPREQFELAVYSDVEILDDESTERGATAESDSDPRAADGGTTAAGAGPGTTAGSGDPVDLDNLADNHSSGAADGSAGVPASMPEDEPLVVRELKAQIGGLETQTRQMLAFYRAEGPASPQSAHFAAGGDGDRTQAYARNRTLRTRGLIGHVGRGRYDYRLREHLLAELGDHVDEAVVDAYAADIEETALL